MNDNEIIQKLDAAEEDLKQAGQMASAKLRELWNPETRKYEGDWVFFHDLINLQAKSMMKIMHASRALRDQGRQ